MKKPIETEFQWIKPDGKPTQYFADLIRNIQNSTDLGTTTNDNAAEGRIGELLTASAGAVSLVTGTPKNITSRLLTPGDWNIFAPAQFEGNGATTVTEVLASISTVSATLQDAIVGQHAHFRVASTADLMFPAFLFMRVSIAVPTTYYVVAQAAFGVSTYSVSAGIFARRAR
jgi:hypothetical protein